MTNCLPSRPGCTLGSCEEGQGRGGWLIYEDRWLTGGLIQVWSLLPQTFDGSMEVGGFHRFDHIIVHACGQTSFPITLHGMRGHGNDRHMGVTVLLVLPNDCSGLKAIHLWHLHI